MRRAVAGRTDPFRLGAAAIVGAPLQADVALAVASRMLIVVSFLAIGAGLAFGFEIAAMILAVLGWAMALVFPRSPKVGLLGLFVLCAVDPVMRVYLFVPFELPHNTLNYLLLLILVMSLTTLSRHLDQRVALLMAFSVLLALGIPMSSNRFLGLQTTFEVVAGFGLIAAFCRTGLDDRFLGTAAVSVGIATACLALTHYIRPPETAINVNALVHVPLMGLIATALAVARRTRRNWWVLGSLAMINLGLAFITASRGGFLAASALALFILWRSPSLRWKTYSVAAAVLALLAVGFFFAESYTSSVGKWGEFVDPNLTAADYTHRRSEIAEFGWAAFKQSPFGTGTGSFIGRSAAVGLHSRGLAAHSAWIKTMTENGIPGLLLLTATVLSFALARPRSPDVTKAIGLLTAVTMSLVFVTSEFQSKALWALIAGTIVLLQQRRRVVGARVGGAAASDLRSGVIRVRRQRAR